MKEKYVSPTALAVIVSPQDILTVSAGDDGVNLPDDDLV